MHLLAHQPKNLVTLQPSAEQLKRWQSLQDLLGDRHVLHPLVLVA
jgi:hypothetical protein